MMVSPDHISCMPLVCLPNDTVTLRFAQVKRQEIQVHGKCAVTTQIESAAKGKKGLGRPNLRSISEVFEERHWRNNLCDGIAGGREEELSALSY